MSVINYLPLNKKKNMLSCVYFAVVEYQMHKGWIVDYCLWLVGCFLLGFKIQYTTSRWQWRSVVEKVVGSHGSQVLTRVKWQGEREGAFSFNASFMHRLWLFLSVLTHPRDHWKKDKTKQKKRGKRGEKRRNGKSSTDLKFWMFSHGKYSCFPRLNKKDM